MTALSLFNSFITRIAFCLHVIVSVALVVVHTKQNLYWCFLSGILFMIIEMLYIMIKRKGREYRSLDILVIIYILDRFYWRFWPSCFLYLSAIIPVIWVLELDLLQHRLDERDQLTKLNNSKQIILSQASIGRYKINASIDAEVAAKKVCELGVLLFIIFGRWLLPRGKLTRDQLSNLLLAYIGMGADILDLFEPLTHRNVKYNVMLTYTILALFTWSMLQFCLVAMATAGSDDDDVSEASCQQKIEKKRKDVSCVESGQPKKPPIDTESIASAKSVDEKESDDESVASTTGSTTTHGSYEPQNENIQNEDPKTTPRCNMLSADLVTILSSLVMHDGPFLIFRLVLLGMYQVTSEIHLFFTAKNALTVAIMLYRLYHLLHVSRVASKEDQDRHRNSKDAAA